MFDNFAEEVAQGSHDLGFGWGWPWRRRISTVCRLRWLKLDATLLTVVTLVCATGVVSVVVVVHSSVIRRGGLVGVVGLGVVLILVVVGARTSGPAGSVEWLASCFAAATCGEAGA